MASPWPSPDPFARHVVLIWSRRCQFDAGISTLMAVAGILGMVSSAHPALYAVSAAIAVLCAAINGAAVAALRSPSRRSLWLCAIGSALFPLLWVSMPVIALLIGALCARHVTMLRHQRVRDALSGNHRPKGGLRARVRQAVRRLSAPPLRAPLAHPA